MLWKRLKIFLLSLALSLLCLYYPPYSSCYADVILTEQEAQEISEEITNSKKELQEVMNDLEVFKKDSIEQKEYYKMQLKEAEKEVNKYKTRSTIGATSSVILAVICIIAILL